MKRILSAAMLGLLVLAGAGAQGKSDDKSAPPQDKAQPTLTKVSGTVELSFSSRPVLKTKDGSYELLYPYDAVANLGVKQGDTISVEGYLVGDGVLAQGLGRGDGPDMKALKSGDAKLLAVRKISFNGKEVFIAAGGMGMGMGMRMGQGMGDDCDDQPNRRNKRR